MTDQTDAEKHEYDANLRWRLAILKDHIENGKLAMVDEVYEQVRDSFNAVRTDPTGEIDLTTVDGRVRSMALAVAHFHNRDEAKKANSLSDVQQTFFEFVDRNLGFLQKAASERGLSAAAFASLAAEQPEMVKYLHPKTPDFLAALEEFWQLASDSTNFHLQDASGTKAAFGGDLFPSYARNIASTAGLYVDTIVLSDPFTHSAPIFKMSSPKTATRLLIKHALNLLSYKDLALADLDVPIVAISPFRSSLDDDERDAMLRIAEVDAVKHSSVLFGETFSSMEEVLHFCRDIETPDQLVSRIKAPNRLLFDTEWDGTLKEQIVRFAGEETSKAFPGKLGELVAVSGIGRMRQATDLLFKSRYLGGTPLIDADTSWRYFNWKLEYNAAVSPSDGTSLHMLKGLQHVSETEFEWLGNIPPSALIELRKSGALGEIREVLSKGIAEIAAAKPDSFFRSSDRIVDNIRTAMAEHQTRMAELRQKQLRFFGYDIGSWVVTGAVEVAAVIAGTPAFGLAAIAANQVLGGPTLREIPSRFKEMKHAGTELRKSPMGIFFKHADKGR